MGSKRNSAAAGSNIEFLRSDNAGKEDKCKEFWKYLDEKKSLPPYQPPKFRDETKPGPCTDPDAGSTARTTKKGPAHPCNKGAKPKKPVKRDGRKPQPSGQYINYEKIFTEGVELFKWDQTPEEMLAEIDEYDRRMNALNPPICPICNKVEKVDCTCTDSDSD